MLTEVTIPTYYWWAMYCINILAFLLIGVLLGEKFSKK